MSDPYLHVSSDFGGVTTAVAVVLVIYLVSSAVYSLTLHPLSRFPGPPLAGITRFPFWIACLTGKQVSWMHNLHKRYGPIVRYSPNDVSFVDDGAASAWKAIHGHEKGGWEFPKAKEWFITPSNGVYGINSAPSHEDHRRFRRLFAPAFSDRALKAQEPLFQRHVDILLSRLKTASQTNTKVDMVQLFQFTTFDIMADLTFGEPLGLLENNKYSPWVQAVFDSIKAIPIAQFIQHYPLLNTIFNLVEPKVVRDMKYNHFRHSADRVDKRLARGSDEPDIWSMVLAAKGDQKLTLEEMYCHADVFMLAGSETTGTTLSGLTYFLLTHPDILARLTKEIRSKYKSETEITMESLASLRYLNACIQESLRVFPAVPVGVPRVVPSSGKAIMGKYVPSGTRVSVHHYSTYHSEENFVDAEKFLPERWMGEDKKFEGDKREAAQPFAYGPRDCIGRNMAMHEMRLVLARVLMRVDLELCEESEGWSDQRAFILWEKKPLMCKVKKVVDRGL
ncbi:cytochrome P450 [Podospora fimiseda]|uniref:Cytochrome P450 n=1 Tax=Podospora fimiseda TaxID=252190 RepID=A0AAN7GWR0_9PEZI|nr:cytochrome P450 [Podospora fimiseda]